MNNANETKSVPNLSMENQMKGTIPTPVSTPTASMGLDEFPSLFEGLESKKVETPSTDEENFTIDILPEKETVIEENTTNNLEKKEELITPVNQKSDELYSQKNINMVEKSAASLQNSFVGFYDKKKVEIASGKLLNRQSENLLEPKEKIDVSQKAEDFMPIKSDDYVISNREVRFKEGTYQRVNTASGLVGKMNQGVLDPVREVFSFLRDSDSKEIEGKNLAAKVAEAKASIAARKKENTNIRVLKKPEEELTPNGYVVISILMILSLIAVTFIIFLAVRRVLY